MSTLNEIILKEIEHARDFRTVSDIRDSILESFTHDRIYAALERLAADKKLMKGGYEGRGNPNSYKPWPQPIRRRTKESPTD